VLGTPVPIAANAATYLVEHGAAGIHASLLAGS